MTLVDKMIAVSCVLSLIAALWSLVSANALRRGGRRYTFGGRPWSEVCARFQSIRKSEPEITYADLETFVVEHIEALRYRGFKEFESRTLAFVYGRVTDSIEEYRLAVDMLRKMLREQPCFLWETCCLRISKSRGDTPVLSRLEKKLIRMKIYEIQHLIQKQTHRSRPWYAFWRRADSPVTTYSTSNGMESVLETEWS